MVDRSTILRVHAGPRPRRRCLVSADLAFDAALPIELRLVGESNRRSCQLEPTPSGCRIWWITVELDAGESRDYQITVASKSRRTKSPWAWQPAPSGHQLTYGDAPLLQVDSQTPYPELTSLCSPSSSRSLIDRFWFAQASDQTKPIRTEPAALPELCCSSVFAELQTRGFWIGSNDRKLAEELIFVRGTLLTKSACMLDVRYGIRASVGPVTLTDEGPFQLRLASTLVPRNCWGCEITEPRPLPSPWLWLTETSSLAIMAHPDNPEGFPTWTQNASGVISHKGSLLNATVRTIPTGESLVYRFRLLAHDRILDDAMIRDYFLDYVSGPRVEVVEAPL